MMTLEGKYKINFFFRKLDAKTSDYAPVRKLQVLEKKFWAKKSFQLICADKIFKTISRNFLKMNWSRDI